jgi:flagellar basal-body rod protein FlgB
MQPLQLFDTAFRQDEWLAQRQSLISANIANANTPGYKAKDIESFDDVMRKAAPMAVTDPRHISADGDIGTVRNVNTDEAEVLESGNNVSLEEEFLKSADVSRSYSMNTQIIKTFSRMLQSATKA